MALRQTRIPIPGKKTTKTEQFVEEVHHKNRFVVTPNRCIYIYTQTDAQTHSRVRYDISKNSFDYALKTLHA